MDMDMDMDIAVGRLSCSAVHWSHSKHLGQTICLRLYKESPKGMRKVDSPNLSLRRSGIGKMRRFQRELR